MSPNVPSSPHRRRNQVVAGIVVAVFVGMVGAAYAAVPMYRAFCQLTGFDGTTGRAKGAVLSHRNLTWVALNTLVDYDIVSTDVALMISPLFHAGPFRAGLEPGNSVLW